MKFTNKQLLERENLHWFYPPEGKRKFCGPPSDLAFREYLGWSERGIPMTEKNNFYAWAKVWRGRTIHELWEDSFYARDGSWPGLYDLLKEEDGRPIPEHVAEFI